MNQFTVSDNIRMRSYLSADAPAFFKATDTNRAYLRPWISWVDRMNNEADALDLIEQGRAKLDRQEALILAIFKEEELIGGIGMQAWNQDLKKAEIGYWLCEKETGNLVSTPPKLRALQPLCNLIPRHGCLRVGEKCKVQHDKKVASSPTYHPLSLRS